MSKKPRCNEAIVNTKTNKPTQKKVGKDLAALTLPVCSGGKQAGISASKTSVSHGRSNSLGSRGPDSTATVNKAGGSLKRGSLGQQAAKQASRPARPSLRLSSSRSFSSLHATSLTAAPFMRSSRSLSRLDQRSTGDESDQVKQGQAAGKKILDSGRLLSSEEHMRENKNQSHGNYAERMKTSSSSQPPESSSSLVPTAAFHHHSNKEKNKTRDGVYTLCAMTAGMRRNWVQAVLKNVRPSLTHEVTGSLSEQKTEQFQEHRTSDWTEDSHQQQQEQESKQQPERARSSPEGNPSSPLLPASPSDSSAPSPINPPQQAEEGEGPHQCPVLTGTTQTDESLCIEGSQNDSCISMALVNDECLEEHSTLSSAAEQSSQQTETTPQKEEQLGSINAACDYMKDKETPACEQHTVQLVKELEQTQRELCRLQQLNRNLQDELQQERESNSREWFCAQNDTHSSSEQALALQRLQKINHDLRVELEAQKRSQEEARETELRRRVDLLAQQAQLLVTGDATALAQAHLEQDRRRFHEQQVEWERCVASLKSQLNISEKQRTDTESQLAQMQQELQSHQSLLQEVELLRKHLQEVTTQLLSNEEAQAQKETRLQKHLLLLQASQDRERKSLSGSLAQAEQHSQELQERLQRAEQQVESLSKTQTLTREIEEAQRQLQEELTCTVSALQRLQEEREQLDHRSQELQNQLSEADREVSRLQSRLKTEETHYYNLEHSYEKASEELQLALGRVQQMEADTQDIREGYERLLDRKEQELSEVLLKMEVLGNSLEETEVKLNEVLNERQQQTTQPLPVNESRPKAIDGTIDVVQVNGNNSHEHPRTRSRSIDASYQCIGTTGDDPQRFMSVIQLLETKLYVTEEKLRDITQRLEEHQSHISCQDPHLCSQLTQSRATAQHLSLLLHSQAKRSQRFAQETENRCRMLVGRFQVALNIIQACRERLQTTPTNIPDFERQLATVAACLQQGEKDAEKQQHESYNASKGEAKILNDVKLNTAESHISTKSKLSNAQSSADDMGSVRKCLTREVFVVEKMLSVLLSQCGIFQQSLVSREEEGGVAQKYKNIVSQIIALKTKERMQSAGTDSDGDELLESAIGRVCAEAELIYASLKCQQQYESTTQESNQEVEHQRTGLADVSPPELAPYEEQVQVDSRGLEEAVKPVAKDQSDDSKAKAVPDWLGRLTSRLQRRAKFLHQLCQEISDDNSQVSECSSGEDASADDLNCMQDQAKLIYLSDRLYSDLEFQQSEMLQNKLQALCKKQDMKLMEEQEAFNHTIIQLQEDNCELREELEQAEQKIISVETGNQRLLEDIQKIEDYHEERIQKLNADFQEKIKELQQIHEDEMKHLHGYYTKEKQAKSCTEAPESSSSLPDQTVMERKTKEDSGTWMVGGDAAAMRESYQKDLEKLQASCDQGLTAMEEMHMKLMGDLHQQHQKEVADLLKEKDQLLQEETAATMAAIVAMRRAHKQELEKSRQCQRIRERADITELHIEYEKELQLLHKELEMLSLQHTEKCLENSQLTHELQDERKSVMQYQKENQELKKKQRETDEMSQLHFSMNGKQSHVGPQVNNFYELEVILRAREAEMQFLRQEARSLRDELKIARMDKIYAQNKLKALYTNNQDEPYQRVNKLGEDFQFASLSAGRDTSGQTLEDAMTHNSAFPKKTEKSSLLRQIRGVRSKSLKEGLSVQERMKLFESF